MAEKLRGPLAAASLAAVGFAALFTLSAPQTNDEPPLPGAFLNRALGSPHADAPLTRTPAAGVDVEIDHDGYRVRTEAGTVVVESRERAAGNWTRFRNGVSRPTAFGAETVVIEEEKAEHYLTVAERQGVRTWRWRLASGDLLPRVGDDGAVAFLERGRLADVSIAPAAVYDMAGRDVTPDGARWSLRRADRAWSLELRLDDSDLPLPYVVDPAVVFRAASSNVVPNGTNVSTLRISRPAGLAAGDALVAQVAVKSNTTPITAPAGWSLVRRELAGSGASQISQAVFFRLAQGSEPAAYDWTFGSAFEAGGGIVAYSGVDTATPIDVTGGATGSGSLLTAPSVTTTVAGAQLVALFATETETSVTPPVTMAARYGGPGGVSVAAADETQLLAGASGPRTATALNNGNWVAHVVALRPTSDATPPSSPVLSVTESEEDEHVAGTTLFYNPSGFNAGTFTVDAATSDPESGIARVNFPTLVGMTGGGDDSSSPYQAAYAWTSASLASGSQTVTAYNGAGGTAGATFTVTPDSLGPAVAISSPSAGATIRDGAMVAADASDLAAGVADVEFRYCSGLVCSWASGTPIGTDTTAPYSSAWSSQPADGTYTLLARATDNVGNATDSTPVTVTVDNTAPATALSVAEGARADLQHFDAATSTLYYNPGSGGDFRLTEAATDAIGIQVVEFPAVSKTGFAGPAATDVLAPYESGLYAFDASNVAAPAPAAVRVTDLAGNSRVDTLSFVRDTAAPTGGSVAYRDGYERGVAVSVTTTDGTDASAGIDSTSAVVERDSAPLAGGACGAFANAWAAVPRTDETVATGKCYRYRYRVSDRVGNEAVYASAAVVKIDRTAPTGPALALSESEPDEHVAGTTLFYNPSGSNAGTFTVTATTADAEAGVAAVDFPAVFGADGVSDGASPYETAYSWNAASTADGARTVTASNAAGLTADATFSVTPDAAAPSVSLSAPASGAAVKDGDSLTASATDALAGTTRVEFRYCAGTSCAWDAATPIGADATAPFAVAWSAQPPDGEYALLARATDNVGNAAVSAAAAVVVDNALPVATVNNPGTPLQGLVTLEATASDGLAGVAATTFQVSPAGDDRWTPVGTDSVSPYAVSWDTLTVADGRYDIRVVATDRAGNTATSMPVRNRQVTNHPPHVTITEPGDYYVNAASFDPFTVTATSPNTDLRHVEFFGCTDASTSCATGTWVSLGVDAEAPYSAPWPIHADGNRALKAVATNRAWAEGIDVNNVLIDRAAPTGATISYADGFTATGIVALVTSVGTDAGSGLDASSGIVERQTAPLSEGVCGAFGPWVGAPANPDSAPHGACARYRFRIFDEAGNDAVAASTALVRVDETAPPEPTLALAETEPDAHVSGTTLYYAATGANSGSFIVRASAADLESGVRDVAFPELDTVAPYEATASWTAATEGGARVVTVTNNAGLASAATFTLTPDVEAPAAFALEAVGHDTVTAAPTDTPSGIASVEFRYCAGSVCSWGAATAAGRDATAPYAVQWASQPADGVYTLLARATDNVGNATDSTPLFVTVASTPPPVEPPPPPVEPPPPPVVGTPPPALTLAVTAPSRLAWSKRSPIVLRMALSRPAGVRTTLVSPTGKTLHTRSRQLPAGTATVRLYVGAVIRKPGLHAVRVSATAGGEARTAVRRIRVLPPQ